MTKITTWAATLATLMTSVALTGVSAANAADLGGNCCADLEERIAELEATTARKGNRKVSLTVSGWVNEALFLWDDGVERNTYVGTNGREQSRVRFVGDAKINSDLSAGYILEIGVWGADSRNFTQDDDSGGSRAGTTTLRRSSWFLKSKTFGKFLVGKDAPANYHLLDDANATNTRTFADPEANDYALGGFFARNSNGKGFILNTTPNPDANLKWTDILVGVQNDTIGQDGLRNVVRYDSPEFAGFTFTATWGEDDIWATSLTYKNTLGDFDLLGKVGYGEVTDEGQRCAPKPGATDESCEMWGVAGTVLHKPTGLYVFAAYSGAKDENRKDVQAQADDSDSLWFVQAGIERKWLDLGKTTIYGQYQESDGGSNVNVNLAGLGGGFIQSSDINFWGLGVVQKIENAAMDLYVTYTHAEGDFKLNDAGAISKVNLEEFDSIITGARVQF